MENQHRKISGYRELDEEEIALMNRIKAFGPQLEELVHDIRLFTSNKAKEHFDVAHDEVQDADIRAEAGRLLDQLNDAEPQRWLALGKTALQEGLMKLTRSVARPAFF